jgi:uncharacterized membrane protein YGL010W
MAHGTFEWQRRMGVHEAYHRSGVNRLIHWVCIPLELACAAKLLALASWSTWLDGAIVGIAALGVVYLATEIVMGAAMVGLLLALREAALRVSSGTWSIDALAAAALFVALFQFQTRVGHGVFERGIDDTDKNFAELGRTKNPIPIVLVFYYHLVELFLAAGYRPALRAAIAAHTREELARMGGDSP